MAAYYNQRIQSILTSPTYFNRTVNAGEEETLRSVREREEGAGRKQE